MAIGESFEFIFSILASHAEEESKNISENNRWKVNHEPEFTYVKFFNLHRFIYLGELVPL